MIDVGLIGFGAIGRTVAARFATNPVAGYRLTHLLVRPAQRDEAQMLLPGARVLTDERAFIAEAPRLVIEAAGHGAMLSLAEPLLAEGRELMCISTGVLADAAFRAHIADVAKAAGGRISLPVGALAGFDGLLALRQAGLSRVRYTSAKPPRSWKGTAAETVVDLDQLSERTVFFTGSASQSALLYPKNANLSASVALAGLGFDATEVLLVADPALSGPVGFLEAEGPLSRLEIKVSGVPSAGNAKTSAITGYSILAMLENRVSALAF